MFKAIILLRRKSGTTAAEFREWWLEQHAPLARQLPELQRLCFNLVDTETNTQYDGVSELWFKTRKDFETAYTSEIGQRVAADSIANLDSRERLLVEEHFQNSQNS